MTTMAAINWDQWRASYDEMGFAGQQAFYNDVYAAQPAQRRFSEKAFAQLAARIPDSFDVVEVGGWDGEGAAAALAVHPQIRCWRNYEISQAAVANTVCADPRYQPVALTDWYWADQHTADVFVASHVLEHLILEDVRRTLDATLFRWAFVQAPLLDGPTDWAGYHGSHILEIGWPALADEFIGRGYRLLGNLTRPHLRCFERR